MSHGKSVQIIIHQDLELVKGMASNAIPFLHPNTTNNAINKKNENLLFTSHLQNTNKMPVERTLGVGELGEKREAEEEKLVSNKICFIESS